MNMHFLFLTKIDKFDDFYENSKERDKTKLKEINIDLLNNPAINFQKVYFINNNNLESKIILETAAGQGTELLSNYNDFLDFYNSFNQTQKKYLKICIDTCHTWASGFDLKEIIEITKKNNNMNDIIIIHANQFIT